jgi:hypothetical protein
MTFLTVKTRQKSAPFQVGYLPDFRDPILPITGRHSLPLASFTPSTFPLPCGRDTTRHRGVWG